MRTALVTGATSGIGARAAERLGERGWRVLVHGRDRDRGERVADRVTDAGGEGAFLAADFLRLDDVRGLADEVRARTDRLDALVNNAGLSLAERRVVDLGRPVEGTLVANHLAPYLLTRELIDHVSERVVVTASEVHRRGDLWLDDLALEAEYRPFGAYARSKLANVLFAVELADRLDRRTANAYHPGFVPGSRLYRETNPLFRVAIRAARLVPFVGTSVGEGAAGLARLAADDDVADVTGAYFDRRERVAPDERARDEQLRGRLWDLSAELVGAEPDWP